MRPGHCSRAKQIRPSESCRVAREQTAGARRELESRLARFLKGGLCFCLFVTESNRRYLRTTLYLKRTAFGKRPPLQFERPRVERARRRRRAALAPNATTATSARAAGARAARRSRPHRRRRASKREA